MFIAQPEDSEATAKIYRASADSQGFVMNLTKAWAWRPDIYEGFTALRGQLTGQSTLAKRELAVLVCATAAELGDSYCSLAWGSTLAKEAGPQAAAAVLTDAPQASLSERDGALAAWARKLVADPNATTRADVDALRRSGLTEKEIFEATVFVAFRQAFSTVNDALGIHPDAQLAEQAPAEVREAVTFGRAAGPAGA